MNDPKHVYVGTIPDVFGYGINVVALTRFSAETALRKAYAKWKKAYPDSSTDFDFSYQYYGGSIKRVAINKTYHNNFAE
jgi:hypothetical protein